MTKLRAFALVVTVSVVCLAAGNLLGAPDVRTPEKKNVPLIEQLLDRIEKLEARLKEIETHQAMDALPHKLPAQAIPPVQIPDMQFVPRSSAAQGLYKSAQPVPKGWRQLEFNGRPYYMVPLSSSRRGARPTADAR